MRITCPLCGARDRREFHYKGDAVALDRPDRTRRRGGLARLHP